MIGTLEHDGAVRVRSPLRAPHLAHLLEQHPRLDLRLHFQDAYLDLVARGIDLAIRIGQLPDSSRWPAPSPRSRWCLCASPAYLARRPAPQQPQDLADHPWTLYSLRQPTNRVTVTRGDEEVTLSVSGRVVADDGSALAAFIQAGSGIGLLPIWYVADDIRAGRLTRILPEWGGRRRASTPSTRPGGCSRPRSGGWWTCSRTPSRIPLGRGVSRRVTAGQFCPSTKNTVTDPGPPRANCW
ncbi:MAG: substrate binding domain-containing protein [bacterium]